MIYLIVIGSLLAAVAVSFVLSKLTWALPAIRKFHELAIYSEILEKNLGEQIDEHLPLAEFTSSDDAYLFEAIKLLVRHEPSRAATIVITLEPQLSQLQKDMFELGVEAQNAFHAAAEDWAQHMMTVAPTSWVEDLWKKADHEWDQIWLFEYIFNNKVKPITLCDEFSDRISIECEQEILFLKASRKEYNTLKYTKDILAANQNHKEINRDPIPEIYMTVAQRRPLSWTANTERWPIAPSAPHLGENKNTVGALVAQSIEAMAINESGR